MSQIQGITAAKGRAHQKELPQSKQRQDEQQGIADDSEYGHRDAMNDSKAAVVHNAAVPVCIDVTGLEVSGVVDPQRERRYDDA